MNQESDSHDMTVRSVLTADCSHKSYWLDDLPVAPITLEIPLAEIDVAIVGSGYTGLHAAIETARGGRSTMVLDAQDPGWGCSTRNGGQISTSVKPSLDKLTQQYGLVRAQAIRQEGETALQWIEDFVTQERLNCDFQRKGRYHAAHTPAHYEELARDVETLNRTERTEASMVSRAEQRDELGSDAYYGGAVFPRHAAINPAKYHRGLLTLAVSAGAHVVGHCAVKNIERQRTGFILNTEKGRVYAGEVIVATNGYTTSLTPWLQRRVIPIGSYIIATEPLPEKLVKDMFPTDRIASDTCKVIYYYRTSPDGRRILFGGRVSAKETDTTISGPKLFNDMCRIFPQLLPYRISHSWMGTVAYTFDELAHTGVHDGVHYAMGYCGSGVSMASHLGRRLGQKVLGLKDGATAFDDLKNPTRPLYTGNPWFLPATVAWYRRLDRHQYQKAAAQDSDIHDR